MKNTKELQREINKVAFSEIHKQNKSFVEKWVYSISRKSNLDEFDSEDIIQDVWIKLYANLHLYNSEKGIFQAWLFKIILNECRKAIVKKNNLPVFLNTTNLFIKNNIADYQKHEFEQINNDVKISIAKDKLNNCINKLKKGQKRVLKMHLEGYSHDEIAEYFNISANTSRSQTKRAKKKVKELYYQL